ARAGLVLAGQFFRGLLGSGFVSGRLLRLGCIGIGLGSGVGGRRHLCLFLIGHDRSLVFAFFLRLTHGHGFGGFFHLWRRGRRGGTRFLILVIFVVIVL